MQVIFDTDAEFDNTLVARLRGTVDVLGAESFWELLAARVSESVPFVLIDLSEVGVITSAGIGTMVRLYTRLKGYGGGLAIYGCNEKICEIFSIVMLEELLQISASEDEAREKLQKMRSN